MELYPAWSPDGKMVKYRVLSRKDNQNGLYMVASSGGKATKLAGGAWSPDSKRIAFNEVGIKAIKVMSLSDGSIEDIKTGLVDAYIYHLDWSPDGERFVFGGATGGNKELWLMDGFLPL